MRPPDARTFGGLIRELAGLYPDRPALAFEGRRISFRELDVDADRFARALLARGVRRGEVVSVLAGNRPEWVSAFLGATRIGAVLAPLNTWYKQEELAYGLRHPGAKVLFTVDRLLKQDYSRMLGGILGDLPALETVVALGPVDLDGAVPAEAFLEEGGRIPDAVLREAEAAVEPSDMAFLLYTSGSTAAPKGVQIHHGDALENCFNIGEAQHLGPEDRVWLVTPLFYGFAAVNAVPASWTHGACLVLQETFDPGRALELIEREQATVYYGFGNITRALLAHPDFAERDLSSLQKGVTAFSAEDKRLAIVDLGVSRCCSPYGLTESYGNCTITDADDPLEVKLETQGRALPGWELKVVDPVDESARPAGEVGHLLIRGHVTSGYFGDADTTAAAFDEEGFFRTGDLARIGADGRLRFASRLKEMMKVGGINVSPREVEELIDQHPDVGQVHVVGVADPVKGEVVVAFVEPLRAGCDEESIRAFVAERAASFKVPAHVLFRSDAQLPRVASGKVPKHQLREEAARELDIPA
jgi:fatty-acyl-CoA synthase